MPSPHSFSATRAAGGLTLLELLLVLVLLVVIFAMVVPQLTSVTTRRELISGADQVRSALTKARNQAMRTGEQVVLLYQPETPFYARAPVPVDEASATQFETTQAHLTQLASVGEEVWDLNTWDSSTTPSAVQRLPRDVLFSHPLDSSFPLDAPEQDAVSGNFRSSATGMITGGLSALTSGSNGQMVVFFPDGTASETTLDLQNAEGDRVTIAVRGLTGIVSVGQIIMAQPNDLLGAGSR